MLEQEIIEQLKKGQPFDGLGDIRVIDTQIKPSFYGDIRPDVVIMLEYGDISLRVFGEVKTQVSPKILNQIGLWLKRAKALNPTETYALICPFLSPQSQKYCQENNIDFIDLSGNILLRIPGKILIERLGRPNLYKEKRVLRDPFGGKSSRVIRVLLQYPKRKWMVDEVRRRATEIVQRELEPPKQKLTVTDESRKRTAEALLTVSMIEEELIQESQRQNKKVAFLLSLSSISKTIQSLEEELLIRREGLQIVIPDQRRILILWAEKYRERYKWMRRSAWTAKNPFGFDVESSIKGLKERFPNLEYLLTGTAAANLIAPFANVDRIDIFIQRNELDQELKNLNNEPSVGPDFLFIYPYDDGVAMYAQEIKGLTVASAIQTYLDCYTRGGRDAKQADYLLTNVIEKQWNKE